MVVDFGRCESAWICTACTPQINLVSTTFVYPYVGLAWGKALWICHLSLSFHLDFFKSLLAFFENPFPKILFLCLHMP